MADAPACERLRDVPLRLAEGGAANLAHFRGRKLAIFFCPADAQAAAREIEAYTALAPAFEGAGAWVVGVAAGGTGKAPRGAGGARLPLGVDPDGSAFARLARHAPPDAKMDAIAGAAFLIDRDGVVRHAWTGCGHTLAALAAARERP